MSGGDRELMLPENWGNSEMVSGILMSPTLKHQYSYKDNLDSDKQGKAVFAVKRALV